MTNTFPTISFIGAGRVGSALARAFAAAGAPVCAVHSRSLAAAHRLAAAVPGCAVCDTPQQAAESAAITFLTVVDDAIAATAAGIAWRAGMAAVHCSGASTLDLLTAARLGGAQIGSLHPIQTFAADAAVTLRNLPGSTITLAGDPPLVAQLAQLSHAIGGRVIAVPDDKRALYHAAGYFVGPAVIALMQEFLRCWRVLGVSDADSFATIFALLRGTIEGVEQRGLAGGLAGVVSRGDIGVIQRHLSALAADAPDSLPIYRELNARTVPLALAAGRITPEQAATITALLRGET